MLGLEVTWLFSFFLLFCFFFGGEGEKERVENIGAEIVLTPAPPQGSPLKRHDIQRGLTVCGDEMRTKDLSVIATKVTSKPCATARSGPPSTAQVTPEVRRVAGRQVFAMADTLLVVFLLLGRFAVDMLRTSIITRTGGHNGRQSTWSLSSLPVPPCAGGRREEEGTEMSDLSFSHNVDLFVYLKCFVLQIIIFCINYIF